MRLFCNTFYRIFSTFSHTKDQPLVQMKHIYIFIMETKLHWLDRLIPELDKKYDSNGPLNVMPLENARINKLQICENIEELQYRSCLIFRTWNPPKLTKPTNGHMWPVKMNHQSNEPITYEPQSLFIHFAIISSNLLLYCPQPFLPKYKCVSVTYVFSSEKKNQQHPFSVFHGGTEPVTGLNLKSISLFNVWKCYKDDQYTLFNHHTVFRHIYMHQILPETSASK